MKSICTKVYKALEATLSEKELLQLDYMLDGDGENRFFWGLRKRLYKKYPNKFILWPPTNSKMIRKNKP